MERPGCAVLCSPFCDVSSARFSVSQQTQIEPLSEGDGSGHGGHGRDVKRGVVCGLWWVTGWDRVGHGGGRREGVPRGAQCHLRQMVEDKPSPLVTRVTLQDEAGNRRATGFPGAC